MSTRPTTVVPLIFCVILGCGERPQIRQYVQEPETKQVVTSEVLRTQFPVIPFRWNVPKPWRSSTNDEFSVIAWSAGPANSPEEARITLSKLPGSAGIAPQVMRWRGQIGLPEVDQTEAMKAVETLTIGEDTATWVELTGPQETILGLIVVESDRLWVLKYRSTTETAGRERPGFREFCESLRIEKSGRS